MADLLIAIDMKFSITNEVDITYVGYNLRGFKKLLGIKCDCGKLKKSVVQIMNEERQNCETGIIL